MGQNSILNGNFCIGRFLYNVIILLNNFDGAEDADLGLFKPLELCETNLNKQHL